MEVVDSGSGLKRLSVTKEIVFTERRYVNDLSLLVRHFRDPLYEDGDLQDILTLEQKADIFINMDDILAVHRDLFERLRVRMGFSFDDEFDVEPDLDATPTSSQRVGMVRRYRRGATAMEQPKLTPSGEIEAATMVPSCPSRGEENPQTRIAAGMSSLRLQLKSSTFDIGDIFRDMAPRLQGVYDTFCRKYTKSRDVASTCKKTIPSFADFLERQCSDVEELCGLTLRDLMIKPIQRLCKYPILFEQLMKHTPSDHKDMVLLRDCTEKLSSVVAHINVSKKEAENIHNLLRIENGVSGFKLPIAVPGRKYIHEGLLMTLGRQGRPSVRMCFLLSDVVLITQPNAGVLRGEVDASLATYAYRWYYLLAADTKVVKEESTHVARPFGFMMNSLWSGRAATFYAPGERELSMWVMKIRKAVKKMPTRHPKSLLPEEVPNSAKLSGNILTRGGLSASTAHLTSLTQLSPLLGGRKSAKSPSQPSSSSNSAPSSLISEDPSSASPAPRRRGGSSTAAHRRTSTSLLEHSSSKKRRSGYGSALFSRRPSHGGSSGSGRWRSSKILRRKKEHSGSKMISMGVKEENGCDVPKGKSEQKEEESASGGGRAGLLKKDPSKEESQSTQTTPSAMQWGRAPPKTKEELAEYKAFMKQRFQREQMILEERKRSRMAARVVPSEADKDQLEESDRDDDGGGGEENDDPKMKEDDPKMKEDDLKANEDDLKANEDDLTKEDDPKTNEDDLTIEDDLVKTDDSDTTILPFCQQMSSLSMNDGSTGHDSAGHDLVVDDDGEDDDDVEEEEVVREFYASSARSLSALSAACDDVDENSSLGVGQNTSAVNLIDYLRGRSAGGRSSLRLSRDEPLFQRDDGSMGVISESPMVGAGDSGVEGDEPIPQARSWHLLHLLGGPGDDGDAYAASL